MLSRCGSEVKAQTQGTPSELHLYDLKKLCLPRLLTTMPNHQLFTHPRLPAPAPGEGCSLPSQPLSALALLLMQWREDGAPPTLAVTDSPRQLEKLYQDLHSLSGGHSADYLYFPAWEDLQGSDLRGNSPEIAGDRLLCLSTLRQNPDSFTLLCPVQALMQSVPSPESLERRSLRLSLGSEQDPEALCETLIEWGYRFEAEVMDKGEAARRGGVLDLWPPQEPSPLRLEFFGNELDSLRSFDPATQRSVDNLTTLELLPAREQIPEATHSLFEYLPPTCRVLLIEEPTLFDHAALFAETQEEPLMDAGDLQLKLSGICGGGLLATGAGLTAPELDLPLSALAGLQDLHVDGLVRDPVEIERQRMLEQWRGRVKAGGEVHLFLNTDGAVQRFRDVYGKLLKGRYALKLHEGMLSEGLETRDGKLTLVAESDLYGIRKSQRNKYDPHASTRKGRPAAGARLTEWNDIQPGEWVVHVDHGIGKYLGLYQIEAAGQIQEVLSIEYAEGARLHVPITQAHLLTRYIGVGAGIPEPHALGDGRWSRQKVVAEQAVKDLAAQLLQQQAIREALPGHAFSADSSWQAEFEATFPFTETVDQEGAIAAVKSDMESSKPMDRLICGDVGYGKTEVAMRAAFKAVMDGKQAALLVPTTILALQHYQSFQERMAAFPIRIEMLSRFRSAQQQRETLARMRRGECDIVIGTHRLTSKDVQFQDLGLVIIDEEQRFGVRHKERLKEMKGLVDVLTLSATPIPRTLYLSLTGARDVSNIQTAPRERLPVKTEVHLHDLDVIRKAILRELNRGGQVFFLHNRVQSIEILRRQLLEKVPEARISVAHGQMPERQLEDIMRRFSEGESDVLLCTTIIESGVDMPNVNTMIIDRADRFGLAELYQLRGRVGRYKHQAFCLLLLPPEGAGRQISKERIRAIQKYSQLGSGFKIALRDLEIRGAGNLLGSQQSGHIAGVGFDLYCQLLEQSIRQLKKLPPQRLAECRVSLDFLDLSPSASGDAACCLPESYLEDEALRVELYRRLAGLASLKAVNELEQELKDRFGEPVLAVKNLLNLARVRVTASLAGLQEVRVKDQIVHLRRGESFVKQGHRFPRLEKKKPTALLKELIQLIKTLSADS